MANKEIEAVSTVSSFEKQRDQLVQEITAAMDSVVYNLETLNRSLKDTIEVGTGFQDASRLWATFYKGDSTKEATSDTVTDNLPAGSDNIDGLETEAVNVEAPESAQE